jgi:hypothetical protein
VILGHRAVWSGGNVLSVCLCIALVGCAGRSHVKTTPEPLGSVELLGLFPAAGSMVDVDTVIRAVLRYEVQPFQKGVYFLMPQLETHDPPATMSGPVPQGGYPRLNAPTGRSTVELSVSGVWRDRNIVKPLQVWFYLNRADGGGRSTVIAKIGPLVFPAGEGAQ